MEANAAPRRPIRARESRWAQAAASYLARCGVQPNTISLASIACAAAAGLALVFSADAESGAKIAGLLCAALGIQLRLVCNLLDGMVAIEGGRRTKSGEVFNDLPDRIADPLILVSMGYAIPEYGFAVALGWSAGLLAVMTAYVRLLGGAAGLAQRFTGPMAKQHRMAVTTAALVLAATAVPFGLQAPVLLTGLFIVVVGSGLTVWRRTAAVVRDLEAA